MRGSRRNMGLLTPQLGCWPGQTEFPQHVAPLPCLAGTAAGQVGNVPSHRPHKPADVEGVQSCQNQNIRRQPSGRCFISSVSVYKAPTMCRDLG